MKKLLSVLVAVCLCGAALVACGDKADDTTASTTTKAPTTTTTTTEKAPDTNEPETNEPPKFEISTDTTGAICINDIEGATAKVYAFEQPGEFGGPVGLIYNFEDKTTAVHTAVMDAIANDGAFAVVSIDGELFKIEQYANSGNFLRLNVESAGATLISGISYEVIVYIYNADSTMTHYAKAETIVSALSTANAPERAPLNITLPEGLTKVTVKADSIAAAEGFGAWGDGAPANLFDGDNAGTKIGGGTNGSVTVTFSLDAAATVTYYTLYTGGDTASNSGRNPLGWTLYGEVNGEWVELSNVAATKTNVTGLEATNSTPYSYKVSAPAECVNYKIVFVTGSAFQLNEMELFVG